MFKKKCQGCFKKVSRVFQGSCKGFWRNFQGCFTIFSWVFKGSLKVVSRKFQECFEGILRVFQGSFKGVSWKFDGRGSFKGVSRVFRESFKKTFKVFQKSSMLHGTHRSFPSRRRACCIESYFLQFCNWCKNLTNCCIYFRVLIWTNSQCQWLSW